MKLKMDRMVTNIAVKFGEVKITITGNSANVELDELKSLLDVKALISIDDGQSKLPAERV